jgi:hypothetical protein
VRDISILSSGTRNPWSSLWRRNRRFQSRDPYQSICHKVNPPIYPTKNYIYKYPPSQLPSTPPPVIETIQHPYGIGPSKPVIKVPVWGSVVLPTNTVYPVATRSTCTIQCHCRQLVEVSRVLPLSTIPHPTLLTFISDIISSSHTFSSQFLSRFRFPWATRASP